MKPTTGIGAVVVAAGSSSRMGFDKLLYKFEGVEVVRRSVNALDSHPQITRLVLVAGQNKPQMQELFRKYPTRKPMQIVSGGETRADSVMAGVVACSDCEFVAIHDGARPFVSKALISRVLDGAQQYGASAPAIPVKDTIKTQLDGFVTGTPPRDSLRAVQTPQVFKRESYLEAAQHQQEEHLPPLTDDCMIMERYGKEVFLVQGEEENIKITTPNDLAKSASFPSNQPRIGHGYDVHRLAPKRKLILGGQEIPYEKGLLGHSDADVLLHAVSDALLGAAALGDIGSHFPDTDPAHKNADSLVLLQKVVHLITQKGFSVGNIDATLLCQQPKLQEYIPAMRQAIAGVLGIPANAVSVKATTEEKLGFTGKGEGIAAHCVALLFRL